jgi:hypothetical protein
LFAVVLTKKMTEHQWHTKLIHVVSVVALLFPKFAPNYYEHIHSTLILYVIFSTFRLSRIPNWRRGVQRHVRR